MHVRWYVRFCCHIIQAIEEWGWWPALVDVSCREEKLHSYELFEEIQVICCNLSAGHSSTSTASNLWPWHLPSSMYLSIYLYIYLPADASFLSREKNICFSNWGHSECVCVAAVWVCQERVPSSPLQGESLQPAVRRAHSDIPSTRRVSAKSRRCHRMEKSQSPEAEDVGHLGWDGWFVFCLPPVLLTVWLLGPPWSWRGSRSTFLLGWPGGWGGLRRGNASRCNMEAGVFPLFSNKMTSSSRDQSQGGFDTLVGGFMCIYKISVSVTFSDLHQRLLCCYWSSLQQPQDCSRAFCQTPLAPLDLHSPAWLQTFWSPRFTRFQKTTSSSSNIKPTLSTHHSRFRKKQIIHANHRSVFPV